MGYKDTRETKNSQQLSQPIKNCQCNHEYATPPTPPNDYDKNLWDLQFCRWWGWNWVRRKEVDAKLISGDDHRTRVPAKLCYKECCKCPRIKEPDCSVVNGRQPEDYPVREQRLLTRQKQANTIVGTKQEEGATVVVRDDDTQKIQCREKTAETINCRSSLRRTTFEKEPIQQMQKTGGSLPTKKQFRDMCKCILGKKTKPCMSLFNTPSASAVNIGRWPKCKEGPAENDPTRQKEDQEKVQLLVPEVSEKNLKKESSEPLDIKTQLSETLDTNLSSTDEISTCPKKTIPRCAKKCISVPPCAAQKRISVPPCATQKRISEPANKQDIPISCWSTKESTDLLKNVTEPPCIQNNARKGINEPQSPQISSSSTEECLSIRFLRITSDISCSCCRSAAPRNDQKVETKQYNRVEQQTSHMTDKGHKDTQTSILDIPKAKEMVEQQTSETVYKDHRDTQTCHQNIPKQKSKYLVEDKARKIKTYKTVCIRVCCCGNCKPSIGENCCTDRKYKPSIEKNCCPEKQNHRDKCAGKCSDAETIIPKKIPAEDWNEVKETYPVIVPPSSTVKMLSKFGRPSQNYSWMHHTGSLDTSTTINDLQETYTSPASGKTYDFSTLHYDNPEKLITLPDLIDITEDLSYLRKLETLTTSGNESRLFLDAVCDAILKEHEDNKYLDFYGENIFKTTASNDFEFLTDFNDKFCTTMDDIDLNYSHEDISNILVDSNLTCGNIDSRIGSIIENILAETKNDVTIREPTRCVSHSANINIKDNERPFKFSGNVDDVFTAETTAGASRRNNIYKKAKKRVASYSFKDEINGVKKLKQEAGEHSLFARETNKKVENIFTKIEDIVKESKIKSAEFQNMFCSIAPKFGESIVQSRTLNSNLNLNYSNDDDMKKATGSESEGKKLTELDSNISKRSYKMSSDAFQGEFSQFTDKSGEYKNMKKSYEVFSEKFTKSLNDCDKSCSSGIVTEVIFEEKNNGCSKENIVMKTFGTDETEETRTKCLEKVSKLSVQCFLVCDEKSTIEDTFSDNGACAAKTDDQRPVKRKKSGSGSYIPIRNRSSCGGNITNLS